ncbi:MAG: hypothetical protein GXO88_06975 [Chlorobi bacterium]|nr:hypothetical protein [Chlorobiota bacterium]
MTPLRIRISSALDRAKVDSDFKWLVVLPGLGCHGCIQEGEAFMRDHIENQRILFVLTKISSLKILQQKIKIRMEEHPNIYIDRKNVFYFPTDNSIYPCIISMENGEIADHEFQSPKNVDAFWKLKKMLEYQ